ncbi:MAG: ATP-binding protein [Chloroflexi bacterium]|nr:ATP-binding protein [Chloroflexota bacterium]MCI0650148.1 ATP-binding protein [Chloroflexota bacterium]MCI0728003.1 ATP-binding protein [Chloroflexota bacterium]
MNEPSIRILLVDDDEDYYVLVRDLLADVAGQQYDLEWVATYEVALEAMATNTHDVCLLDFHLGQRSGLDLLREALAKGCKAPMIMLTGQGGHEIDVEAMQAGAADYLAKKQVDTAILERSVRYAIERSRTLEALRESERRNAELYRKEQERSQELERAYADLRRAEGMRDDLTHMVVHDLRNPLTVIRTGLDMLTKVPTNPSVRAAMPEILANVRGAAREMAGMIDDLLHISKFEAGELRPMLGLLAPAGFLGRKEQAYRSQAEKEKKTLSFQVPLNLPSIRADTELIGRVVDNLISNAFKYTEGGGHIEVRVEQTADALVFQVHDDGRGIPPEYHTRIFDKFVQLTDSKGIPLRKGTGLGLAFCRLAIQAHGGKIWVESTPGQGSTFAFTLPLNLPLD